MKPEKPTDERGRIKADCLVKIKTKKSGGAYAHGRVVGPSPEEPEKYLVDYIEETGRGVHSAEELEIVDKLPSGIREGPPRYQ